MRFALEASVLLGFLTTSLALPVSNRKPIHKRDITPAIAHDFPDPSIIKVDNTWHAFGTQSIYENRQIKTQYATSTDFTTWTLVQNYDALRTLPSWVDANNPQVWAPDVFQLDDGSFMMYFSATTKTAGNGRFHCVGAARSSSIKGPYDSVSDSPIVCPTGEGGAIDASAFRDDDGRRYMLYKLDGNAVGSGGVCNNEYEPQHDTWLAIREVGSDGHTFVGPEHRILNRDDIDGPLIEAPSLVRYPGPKYVLGFSSQCYTNENYDMSYAVSGRIDGNYQKAKLPLLVSGTPPGVYGPGGADVDWDGQHVAFHGYAGREKVGRERYMYVERLTWNGETVELGA